MFEWLINFGLKIFLFFRIFSLFQLNVVLSKLEVGKWIRYLIGLIIPTVIGTLFYTWYFFPSHFFERLFSYTLFFWISIEIFYAFINPFLRYIPTIIGLIFTFISVNVTFLFLIISFWTIETFAIGGFTAIHYVGHTDVMFNPDERLVYQIITGALFSYAVLIGSGGWMVLYPSFLNENLSPFIRKFASNSVFIIVFTVTSFSLFIMSNKLVENNDVFGTLNTSSDIDVKEVIDNMSNIEENFVVNLKMDENDLLRISQNSPHLIEFASNFDTTYHKKYLVRIFEILKGNIDYVFESSQEFDDPSDTSEVSMLLTLNTQLISLTKFPSDTLESEISNMIMDAYTVLRLNNMSNITLERERIKLLIEYYRVLQHIEDVDVNEVRKDLEYFISIIYEHGDPAFGYYCSSRLAEIYLEDRKFHKAEKMILKSNYLFNQYSNELEYSEVEYDFFIRGMKRQKLVLAGSISVQRPGEYALKLFKDIIWEIETDLKDLNYSFVNYRIQYRPYNEMAIAFLGGYIAEKKLIPDSTHFLILNFIERNKARIFKDKVQVNWLKTPPILGRNEVGINYITGLNTILGQIYTADSCFSFSSNLSMMKELWDNIQRQISNNIHPDKELVQNLLDILIPPEFQYIINNTKLYLSPDGEISQIPFQYMLRNFNNKSITILPGFSFLNLNNSKKETICALSARSPSYSNDIISNNILLGLRGRDISPLLFADQEVQNIRRIYNSFNNSNATIVENVTESWVKTNIESFDIIHFAAHSFPFVSEVNEAGILLVSSSEDDGILSASEIASLTLENKLVFLSSCETNVGDFIPGEGINSIASSLLFAGADGVVASLWPVNDKTAVSITDQFYSIYLKTNDPAIAIYKAQELVFTNNPHYSPSQSFPFIYISK